MDKTSHAEHPTREGKATNLHLPLRGPWREIITGLSLLLATAIWLPCLGWLYRPRLDAYVADDHLGPHTDAMLTRHLRLWSDPELRGAEIQRMRSSNAEWDFMGRTFLVLSLANAALIDERYKSTALETIDTILDETFRLEEEKGHLHFLMDYARDRPWRNASGRSLFVDGEIALMLGARQLLKRNEEYDQPLRQRVRIIEESMLGGPVSSGESYPDECWTFCNATALAAVRIHDVLTGDDHSGLYDQWLNTARKRLVSPTSGLLISRYTYSGVPLDGPEGSSIWWSLHCLQLIDPGFAREQYEISRAKLSRELCGFSYAREWPEGEGNSADVDSGPIVPVLGASAGSSGLAFVGARAFGDESYLAGLLASLRLAGFPQWEDGALRFCASNQVGDAVVLYAITQGPLWEAVGPWKKP